MDKSFLKKRRLELNLTMLEVAKKVGVSEATISRWESGNIDNMKRDKIALLAKALEISPLLIVGADYDKNLKTDNPKPPPSLMPKDELEIAKDLEAMLNSLDSQSGMAAYNDPEDEENRELLKASLLTSMRLAKQIARKKFTPKKYRKE